MKARFITLIFTSALLLAGPSLEAAETNSPTPSTQSRREDPGAVHLMPPRLAEQLNLTEDQKAKIKAIEDNFAKVQQAYFAAHQGEIDAANKAMEKAWTDYQEQRKAVAKATVGLQDQRKAALEQIKSLLTEEQRHHAQNPTFRIPSPPADQK